MITERDLIHAFTLAVAHEEGFYAHGKVPSVAQRLNNPCCLTRWCAPDRTEYPVVNGYVEFPDVATGWKAAHDQCRINISKRRLSWLQFFKGKPGLYKGFRPEHPDWAGYAQAVQRRVCAPLTLDPMPWIHSPIIWVAEGQGVSCGPVAA